MTASVKLPSSSVAASLAPLRKTNVPGLAAEPVRSLDDAKKIDRPRRNALQSESTIRRGGIGKIRPLGVPGFVVVIIAPHPHAGTFVDIVFIYIEPALPSRGIFLLSPEGSKLSLLVPEQGFLPRISLVLLE